jgi:hypothetical protein
MPKIDYQNTVIYQLVCPTFDGIYVSYTSNLYVKKFKYANPTKVRKPLEFQDTIDLHGGFNNWKIIVLEKYPECNNTEDAKSKVEEWIKKLQPFPLSLQKLPISLQNPPNSLQNPPNSLQKTPVPISCKKCGKNFTRLDNLQRHTKSRCVIQNNIDVTKEIATLREELESMKKQMKKQMKKGSKTNTNSNNTINQNLQQNNSNNTTINNHNITIELGTEKLSEVFTHKQQKNILEKGYNSLRELIQHVHFNPNYTQFQNLSITNMLGPFGYKYVQDAKDFIIIKKDDLLKELVETRMYDIEEFLENCKGTLLTEKKVKTVSDFIEKMEDKKYASEKIKKLLVDVYNLSADIDMKEVMKKVRNAKHTQDELLLDTLAEPSGPPVHT